MILSILNIVFLVAMFLMGVVNGWNVVKYLGFAPGMPYVFRKGWNLPAFVVWTIMLIVSIVLAV